MIFEPRCFYSVLIFSSAPVASVLTLQFSQRVVIIVGGLLAASGMLLASLDLSLPWLYLTMGILQGCSLRAYSKSPGGMAALFTHCFHSFSLRNATLNLPPNETLVGPLGVLTLNRSGSQPLGRETCRVFQDNFSGS